MTRRSEREIESAIDALEPAIGAGGAGDPGGMYVERDDDSGETTYFIENDPIMVIAGSKLGSGDGLSGDEPRGSDR